MDVIHRQELQITIASGNPSNTGSLSGFTTLGKIVPFAMSWRVADGQSPVLASNTELDITIDSINQITVSRYGSPAYAIDVRVYMIELGSSCTVQSGTMAMTNAETTDTASISTVTTANSIRIFHHKNEGEAAPGNDSDPDGRLVAHKFNSTTEIGFERGLAKGEISGHWWVISSSDLSVQHVTHSNSSAVLTTTDTISDVTMSKTFLICSQRDTDVQYQDNACWDPYIKNTTTVEWRRGYAATNTSTFEYQVVSDQNINVYRNTFESTTTTDSDTFSAVTLANSIAKTAFGRSGMAGSDAYSNGTMDQRFWEVWLNSTTQINGQTGAGSGADFNYMSWEVVEFLPARLISINDTMSLSENVSVATTKFKIEGVTKDKNGSALSTCECYLYKMNAGEDGAVFIAHVQSDGSGNYSFTGLGDADPKYFVIAWKDNTPHVMDCTDYVQTPVEE